MTSTQNPWNRPDAATIFPVRISRATADTDKMYDFYSYIFEAELLHSVDSVDSHHQEISTIFMKLPETSIELQFTQRPSPLTFGDFTVNQYEDLLVETHGSIITNPYCGQDRWMDNHFELSTWTVPGLMDRIHNRLDERGITYRVSKNTVQTASLYTKSRLDEIGFD